MPTSETSHRCQKAVLWVANGVDDYGEAKVDAAIEIDVRWEEGRRESLDAQGNVIAIDATLVVNREIPVDSIMWLGKLGDVADPPVDLKQVSSYNEVPDVKARKFHRTVSLIRYSNELPALA